MKKTVLFAATLASFLAVSSVKAGLNLVSDATFEGSETGTVGAFGSGTPWFNEGSGVITITTNFPHSGNMNAQLGYAGTTLTLGQNIGSLSGGYTVNFWAANLGVAAGTLSVYLGGNDIASVLVPAGSPYTDYNVSGTAGVAPFLFLQWTGASPGAVLELDDVSVTVPEPTTMVAGALMLLPFAASTLRLRKKTSA